MTRSTLGLSVGVRMRAGSTAKPRDWAYSMKVSLSRGAMLSALSTIAFMESGITTGKTPPKYSQAASKPSITASIVWEKESQTNMCRLQQAVNTRAWPTRILPVPSGTRPSRPKSTWHSVPAGGSSTRTVVRACRPAPQRSRQKRDTVRSGTTTPKRPSRTPILTAVRPLFTHSLISASWDSSACQLSPWPSGRLGRTSSQIWPMSASVSWASSPARSTPRVWAAVM